MHECLFVHMMFLCLCIRWIRAVFLNPKLVFHLYVLCVSRERIAGAAAVHVCVCVYIRIIYIYIYMCVCVCIYGRYWHIVSAVRGNSWHIFVYLYMYMHECMHVCMYVCMYICILCHLAVHACEYVCEQALMKQNDDPSTIFAAQLVFSSRDHGPNNQHPGHTHTHTYIYITYTYKCKLLSTTCPKRRGRRAGDLQEWHSTRWWLAVRTCMRSPQAQPVKMCMHKSSET
jgi:hypothetical protein